MCYSMCGACLEVASELQRTTNQHLNAPVPDHLLHVGLCSMHSVLSAHLACPLLHSLCTVRCPAAHTKHSCCKNRPTAQQPDGG